MSRLSVSIVSAIAVLVAITGSASAATSPEIHPAAAAVGDEVTFFNGCLGVVDEPPSEVQVALTQGDEQPDDESAEKTLGTLLQDDDVGSVQLLVRRSRRSAGRLLRFRSSAPLAIGAPISPSQAVPRR